MLINISIYYQTSDIDGDSCGGLRGALELVPRKDLETKFLRQSQINFYSCLPRGNWRREKRLRGCLEIRVTCFRQQNLSKKIVEY